MTLPQPLNRLIDLTAARPSVDWIATIVIVGAHLVLVRKYGHGDFLGWIGEDRRVQIYTAAAGVAAIVAGFAAIAISQYKGAAGRQMQMLKRHAGTEMRRGLRTTLLAPLLVAALCLVAMALDSASSLGAPTRFIFEAGFVFGACRIARLAYLFGALLDIVDVDESAVEKTPRAAVSFVPRRDTA